jgi:hypothetical protein
MDERRSYLKQLAARSARSWSSTPLPAAFAGETRIETRNTVYLLLDGVCYAVRRQPGSDPGQMRPSAAYVGMRVVGWLRQDDPLNGVRHEWTRGAYAVLWRPRAASEEHSAVALTSSTSAFHRIAREAQPTVPVRAVRPSSPPPLPVTRGGLVRPATPPSWIPPPPLSRTRVHDPPDTPTPPRRSSVPPPLPVSARGTPPLPARSSLLN